MPLLRFESKLAHELFMRKVFLKKHGRPLRRLRPFGIVSCIAIP